MSQKKGKTLSEKLAELANPTPQFADPEDEYNEGTQARLESYDDQYESNDIVSKKTLKSKSSLRQKNVELLAVSDKRYAGKRVTRKDLEEDEDDYSAGSSEESISENDEDANDILEFKNKFLKEANTRLKKPSQKNYQDDDSSMNTDIDEEESNESDIDGFHEEEDDDGEEEEDNDEEEEEDDDSEENDEEDLEDEEGDLDEEGASVDDNEENDDKKLSTNSHDSDINKGKSIQNQLSLYDHLLECRIKLHKGINLSNQLPPASSSYKLFTKVPGENHFVTSGQGAQVAIKTLLDSCLELQELLLKSNPQTKSLVKRKSGEAKEDDGDEEIPSDTDEEAGLDDEEEENDGAPKRKKLKMAEYETEIGGRHENFRAFCHRTLNMWNEKTRLASGRTGPGAKSGFGAFDQSILKQIEGILADKQRLINRTRIKRSTYRVLGCVKKPQEVVEKSKEEEPKTDDTSPPEAKPVDFEEFDPEIYDDDDFYHQLLRELIEKRTGEAGSNQVALGRQWLEIQKLRSKAKRKVDSKASKGRRLRYQVHPKLVSFMAPYPETSWNDIAKNELFASLFGSGLTVT